MRLLLVRQRQAEGEPRHWSLFLSRENQAGTVYQVKGDATYMRFDHAANVNILNSTSLLDSYIICDNMTESSIAWLQRIVQEELPPNAPNRREVKENCQGWTLRVLSKLARYGVINAGWVESARGMMDQV